MNRPTFHETVDVLVKAYLNDTLTHGFCTACAVGNIVAHSLGIELIRKFSWSSPDWEHSRPLWPKVFLCSGEGPEKEHFQTFDPDAYKDPLVKAEIDSTGYTWQELAEIELAFESADEKCADRMFQGLMNVVDVLAEIHQVDLSVREEAKAMFVKP